MKCRSSTLTIAVLKRFLDRVLFYCMDILISNKNVNQDLVVESRKHKYLPRFALFYWCEFSRISLSISLLCFVYVYTSIALDSQAGSHIA